MAYRRYPKGIRKLLKKARDARTRKLVLRTVSNAIYGPRGQPRSLNAFGAKKEDATEEQLMNRRRWRFKGRGRYSVGRFISDVGALGEAAKKTYNSWIPKSLRNQAIGIASSALGRVGGGGLYTGRGAYVANSLVAGGDPEIGYDAPNDETGTIMISNREYVTDVYGGSNSRFTNNSLMINPGLQQNFPWLSQIASNYEEYEFVQLLFLYKATIDIGNMNTTGQSGTIMMVTDYNPAHAPFESKEAMMQYQGAVCGKATDDIVCGVECDPAKNPTLATYVRTVPVPYGEDPKTYDMGIFQFALNNIPAAMYNQQLGELWVEYTVKLRTPKLAVNRGNVIQMDQFCSGTVPGTNQATWAASPMGDLTRMLTASSSNLGCSISYATPSTDVSQATSATVSSVWFSPYQQLLGGSGSGATGVLFTTGAEDSAVSATGYPNLNKIVNSTGAAGAVPRLMITFPAAYNGICEIIISLNQSAVETVGAAIHALAPLEFYRGNVKPYRGYRQGVTAFTNTVIPAASGCHCITSMHALSYGLSETICIKLLVDVTSATAGVNNSVMFDTKRWFRNADASTYAETASGNQGAISSMMIEIKEYNPLFATSGSVDYSIMRDPLGVVTTPYGN